MSSIGQIYLELGIDTNKFRKQVDGIKKQSTGTLGAFSVAFGNVMANMATQAAKAVGRFFKDSVRAGSDLAELQNVVDSVFTTMSSQVESFSQNALSQFGLTEGQAKKMMGTFGAMSKAFNFTEEQAFGMSASLTGLAGDVASFYNTSIDEAYTKLKSVYTGETESLKELGVVMTQAALDEFALANGFSKTTANMSEQEKVALRLAFVQNKLATASGDVVRTQDSWANQTRMLSGQIESLKASIGQGLISLLTPAIQFLNIFMGKLVQAGKLFAQFVALLTGKGGGAKSGGAAMAGVAEAANIASEATGGMASGATKAAKAAKEAQKALMGFDQINNLEGASGSDAGGAGAGGGGGAGGVGSFGNFGADLFPPAVADDTTGRVQAFIDKLVPIFDPAIAALGRLKDSFAPLGENIGAGLKWILDNVLGPLAVFTISEVVPRFLDGLGFVLGIVNGVIEALKPLWKWLWDNLFAPIAKWTGGVVLDILDGVNTKLSDFGNWINNNKKTVETIAILVGSLAAAIGLVNGVLKIWTGIQTAWTIATTLAASATTIFSTAMAVLTAPITLVIAAIAAAIAAAILLWKNWDQVSAWIKKVWDNIATWATTTWSNIVATIKGAFNGIGSWFSSVFTGAWNMVTRAFSSVGTFFNGVFNTIKNIFTTIGTTIGNAIGDSFKYVVNSVIGFAERTINGFIRSINDAISLINLIPGVNIKKISLMKIPKLATGGMIKQPTLAMVGEAGKEAVLPIDRDRGAMQQIADMIFEKMGLGGGDQGGEISLSVDGEVLFKIFMDRLNKKRRQRGLDVIEY